MELQEVTAALAALADDVHVCRCEEVTAGEIREAVATGAVSVNDVKRRTRAGMGMCQGIFCTQTIAVMIHTQAGVPIENIGPMTARPPARAISLAALAGIDLE